MCFKVQFIHFCRFYGFEMTLKVTDHKNGSFGDGSKTFQSKRSPLDLRSKTQILPAGNTAALPEKIEKKFESCPNIKIFIKVLAWFFVIEIGVVYANSILYCLDPNRNIYETELPDSRVRFVSPIGSKSDFGGPYFWISSMISRYYPEIHFYTHFWNFNSQKIPWHQKISFSKADFY